jgi:FtsP/CotA-like multicopper oxidase with cupredoxin domain
VINPSFFEHPLHLHGSFYQVLSAGDFQTDTAYAQADRPLVVTQTLFSGHTMMMQWSPSHVGRWLFHCHFARHIGSDDRVPMLYHASSEANNPHAQRLVGHHEGAMGG